MTKRIDFQTDPSRYRHWRVAYDGAVATLFMDVDEDGGLFDGYQLKLNSYDLGVDIELADVVQRMRFEHPEVGAVVLRSGKERVFCAGANIRMLGVATHAHKVNFCKFTNETRNAFEAAGADSGQHYMCAVKGACAGGGYELALACDHIILTDDGASSVALPEVPLLAVLPGTGGLTRVTDKRKVRRDLADVFCSIEEGVRGKRAQEWRLVDEVVPNSKFEETVAARAREFAAKAPADAKGISLTPLQRAFGEDGSVRYSLVEVQIDRPKGVATITISGPEGEAPASVADLHAEGASSWILRLARELDDAILHLRLNELEVGVLVFKSQGEASKVLAHESFVHAQRGRRLVRARDRTVLEARAQTHRSDLALAGRADRERLVLRGRSRRNPVRLRSNLHDVGRIRGRQSRAGGDHVERRQFRSLSDVERSDAAAARDFSASRARSRRPLGRWARRCKPLRPTSSVS